MTVFPCPIRRPPPRRPARDGRLFRVRAAEPGRSFCERRGGLSLLATGLIVTGVILALIALIQAVAARGWLPESTRLALVGLLVGASYATLTRMAPELAPGFDIVEHPRLRLLRAKGGEQQGDGGKTQAARRHFQNSPL